MSMKGPFISEIAHKTYAINDYGMSSMFVLVGEERALLIDSGVGLSDLNAVVRSVTDKPYDVAITHGHGDHIGGCCQLDRMYLHPADKEMFLTNDVAFLDHYIELMKEMGSGEAYDVPRPIRTEKTPEVLELYDGQVFDLGNRKVRVIHTPNHTSGCCCFLDERERILFSGDACNGNLGLSESVQTSLESLLKLKALESEYDRNFNGHIGYAGKPDCLPQPESTLNDCIWICEHILQGDAPIEDLPENPHQKKGAVVYHGAVRITFSKENLT